MHRRTTHHHTRDTIWHLVIKQTQETTVSSAWQSHFWVRRQKVLWVRHPPHVSWTVHIYDKDANYSTCTPARVVMPAIGVAPQNTRQKNLFLMCTKVLIVNHSHTVVRLVLRGAPFHFNLSQLLKWRPQKLFFLSVRDVSLDPISLSVKFVVCAQDATCIPYCHTPVQLMLYKMTFARRINASLGIRYGTCISQN